MDIAIVTGGNTGMGLAISKKLITLGFRVYAIAEDFSKTPFAHKDFFPISVQLNNSEDLTKAAEDILSKRDSIYLLIHASAKRIDSSFNSLSPLGIQATLNKHLSAPILLTRLFIDRIRQFQGFIINIASENPSCCLSAAIEGSLSSFYDSLFEEYRNQGVNIIQLLFQSIIHSDIINSDMVANTIDHLIRFKGGNAVTKIIIRPQDLNASTKVPQITPFIDEFKEIQLPSKSNFPEEQELIPTLKAQPRPRPSPQKPLPISKVLLPIPKALKESIIIPREKKKKQVPVPHPTPISKTKEKPKRIIKKTAESAPQVSRNTVIIPREKKTKPAAIQAALPLPQEENLPRHPSPLRIRRGRPPQSKESK